MIRIPLRIGTRGSLLALAQTSEACDRLIAAWPDLAEPDALRTVVITTTGDKVRDRPLADLGGKGLFTKEIDEALLAGRIDLAVHSVKDLPTWLPEGLVLAGTLPREDPRDAFIGLTVRHLDELPAGAIVGTSSPRRQAQVLHRRPDLRVVPLRGNVHTRLRRLKEGAIDATLLAVAGLKRLSITEAITAVVEPDELLPAAGQGAVGITCRADDEQLKALLTAVDDAETAARVSAERAMLEALQGSCRTPIAALAELDGQDGLVLRGLIGRPDGSRLIKTTRVGRAEQACALGREAGEELLSRAGSGFFGI